MRKPKACKKIPGIVLLSHSQIYSTIAAGALNYRVREGNVCFCSAMDTGKYIQFKKSLVEVRLKKFTYFVRQRTFFSVLAEQILRKKVVKPHG